MEVVYFELNDWMSGRDFPDDSPFIEWMYSYGPRPAFGIDSWVEKNKLVVVESTVDMSLNYCITAPKSWVEDNCPNLLTKYAEFIRHSEEDGELPVGRFGCPFLEYTKNNIGSHYVELVEDDDGFEFFQFVE